MKQTAVEWLVDELLDGKPLMPSLIEQAKEMEKQQIIDARVFGICYSIDIGDNPIVENLIKSHEYYYNQTFKN